MIDPESIFKTRSECHNFRQRVFNTLRPNFWTASDGPTAAGGNSMRQFAHTQKRINVHRMLMFPVKHNFHVQLCVYNNRIGYISLGVILDDDGFKRQTGHKMVLTDRYRQWGHRLPAMICNMQGMLPLVCATSGKHSNGFTDSTNQQVPPPIPNSLHHKRWPPTSKASNRLLLAYIN